jgi:predicted ester cyclase
MVVDSVNEEAMKVLVEAVEKNDLRQFLKLISDDLLYIDAFGVEAGKDALLSLNTEIFSLWPDRKATLNSWVSKGNTLWLETYHTMTHVNEWHGIPPTDKIIKNQIVWITEFKSGKIVEIREYEKKNEYMKRQMTE